MKERTAYAATEYKVGADHPSLQVECTTVIERLGEISGRLGGCRKALESLVGCPIDGEGRKAADPTCTMVRLVDLVDGIHFAVREVSNQIDRLSRGLG